MEIETEWKRCSKRWQVSFYVVLVCGGVDTSRSRCGSLRMSLCGEMEPWRAQVKGENTSVMSPQHVPC